MMALKTMPITKLQDLKDAIASEPERSPWSDLSVVVNLDQKTVSGFWYSGHDVPGHDALPIIAADANSVSFRGRKGNPGVQISIEGIIDRITGKIEATETWLSKVGNLTTMEYDLRCKPTRPLF
jgi:hypothetical protein